MKETIKFTITQDGTVTEEVIGVKGTQCLDLTEKIENALGNIDWRKETSDYYNKAQIVENQNVTL
tara:strand:- start:223 stop:417 length:195 start_codon:yes stop_codon:yes gene_type:complete